MCVLIFVSPDFSAALLFFYLDLDLHYCDLRNSIRILADATDIVIKNNFAAFPNGTGSEEMIDDQTSGGVTESNNVLNNIPLFVDPDNVDPLLRDFSLQAGSPAIDAGTNVPVPDDIDDVARTGTNDIGAYNE